MKASMVFLGLAVSVSSNIIFTHVPLTCNLTDPRVYHGCLRGQYCTTAGECIPRDHRNPAHYLSFRPEVHGVQPRDAPYSKDGFCGPAHGNTVCDPNSKVYTGVCCSQYGSCGNTIGHCGAGCLFGCTAPPTGFGSGPRSDGQCGSKVGGAICDPKGAFGGCCSQYGFCGSTPDHCLVSNNCQNGCTDNTPKPPTTQSNPSPTGAAPRSDGQCGYKFGGSTCEPQGPYGGCCSQYGFCGKTDGHCLVSNGCQNGCRDGNPAAPIVPTSLTTQSSTSGEPVIGQVKTSMAAEATATARVTTDGTCGGSKGNTVCGNWVNGNCCSMYGFCGKTSAHCGAGCQSGNCLSSPAVPVAGPRPAPAAPNGGTFRVVGQAGVPAMHAGLMPNGRVIFLDKVENYTQLRLVDGHYAMSAEYDPVANTAVPLEYSTNAFCSGGTFLADGRMISVGGNADLPFIDSNIGNGLNAIRYIGRSSIDAGQNGKSWSEPGNKLASARWYATAQTMPDGTVFVASGSLNGLDPTVTANNNPTYEILNPDGSTRGTNVELGILKKNQPYYMYPFVHLLSDGTLFLFTSKASQVFNVGSNTVAKDLPDLPGDYRTYPNTGGSVLLPLSSKNNWAPDIVICGGGAYQDLTSPTDPSCGRIQPLTANAQWEMDYMPEGRGMVEGTLLPDGTVIWMNGGSRGAQGFGLMDAPATEALLYDPAKPVGQRFSTLARSDVPRLYHSVCLLLLDGTVMVAGSNPVEMPILQPDAAHPYVTEWRVENYVPPYLQGDKANQRPTNIVIESKTVRADGSQMIITLIPPHTSDNVKVVLYHGGFVTHSVHMGHRMLNLDIVRSTRGGPVQTLYVTGPPSRNLAPPGPYVLYVLVDGVPGVGQFVQVV